MTVGRKNHFKLDITEVIKDSGHSQSPEIATKQKAASIEVARELGLSESEIEKLLGVRIGAKGSEGRVSARPRIRPVRALLPFREKKV